MEEDIKKEIIGKAGFPLYVDYWEKYFLDMSGEQVKECLKIIFHFNINFEVLRSDDMAVRMVINTIVDNLKRDAQKRIKQSKASRENGKKGGRPETPKKTKKNPTITQDNPPEPTGLSKYTILADGLIFVLEAQMNKKLPAGSQKSYAEEIRKLIEIDLKVRAEAEEDVKRAIQAIANNYGKEYFPVIQSGGSFREKFIKIEDYLKRTQNSKKTELSDTYQNLMNKYRNEENNNSNLLG